MRILVTGARGKVGAATLHRLLQAGHEVTAVDRLAPVYERAGQVRYIQAELTDAGHAAAVVPGHDAVVHAAAIPSPAKNPAHEIFATNLMATYHTLEAAERSGVGRFVHISSETVPGFSYPRRYFHAQYVPVDELHPVTPQDPYALSKWFGEQLMDAVVARSDITAVSVRPTWVQWEGNIERNVGPIVRARGDDKSASFWSYVVVDDLADLLCAAATGEVAGHEVVYAAAADNANGLPLHDLVRRHFGDAVRLLPVQRADASGISCVKADKLFGWTPLRSWRDMLDAEGRLLADVRDRLTAGETAVQRGLAAIS
jgi:nucleoside-diphosphate-sugar epimerase